LNMLRASSERYARSPESRRIPIGLPRRRVSGRMMAVRTERKGTRVQHGTRHEARHEAYYEAYHESRHEAYHEA